MAVLHFPKHSTSVSFVVMASGEWLVVSSEWEYFAIFKIGILIKQGVRVWLLQLLLSGYEPEAFHRFS